MSAYQPVLDPACGGRMFWFDKSDSRVLFGDVRDESWELCDGRRFEVKPDMLMDYRDLPFPDETFRMVVLDPPHLRNAGETSYMAQKYGCLDQETWQTDIKTMFSECFRVLKEHASATNSRTAPEHIGSSSLRRTRNEKSVQGLPAVLDWQRQ